MWRNNLNVVIANAPEWVAGRRVGRSRPRITDAVNTGLTFSVLFQLPSFIFPLLGIVGGWYVVFLAWETLRAARSVSLPTSRQAENAENTQNAWSSLYKGLMVNMLNPHPYLFWLTVGGPLIRGSLRNRRGQRLSVFWTDFMAVS